MTGLRGPAWQRFAWARTILSLSTEAVPIVLLHISKEWQLICMADSVTNPFNLLRRENNSGAWTESLVPRLCLPRLHAEAPLRKKTSLFSVAYKGMSSSGWLQHGCGFIMHGEKASARFNIGITREFYKIPMSDVIAENTREIKLFKLAQSLDHL